MPLILFIGFISFIVGFYWVFVISPYDYQQGMMVKIMYIHVPSAWLSIGIYLLLALMSCIHIIMKSPIAGVISKCCGPIGLVFTSIVLLTGILWGKPMWGVWWVWDARLTSVLILFFIYLGFILIHRFDDNENKLTKIASIYAIFGFLNIPIIKFSVDWWNTLHQPASIIKLGGPSIHNSMLYPLIVVFIFFCLLFIYLLALSLKIELLKGKIKNI